MVQKQKITNNPHGRINLREFVKKFELSTMKKTKTKRIRSKIFHNYAGWTMATFGLHVSLPIYGLGYACPFLSKTSKLFYSPTQQHAAPFIPTSPVNSPQSSLHVRVRQSPIRLFMIFFWAEVRQRESFYSEGL